MQFKVKAGRFVFDKQSKKVKVSKEKGLIHIFHNEEQETHFKWANIETNTQQFDIIVFPGDAVFEAVVDKKNTYVLRFGMDDERYFFWLQEKIDGAKVVEEINKVINYVPEQQSGEMIDEGRPQPEKAPEPEKKVQKSEVKEQPRNQFNSGQELISKLAQGIAAATKRHQNQNQQITALTHLNQVITPEALNTVLKEFSEEDFTKLIQFMPEEHRNAQLIPSTLRSPQFQQALDVLSDALNSENALPLFLELGLNQQYLQKNYGVQAFLFALIQKARKN